MFTFLLALAIPAFAEPASAPSDTPAPVTEPDAPVLEPDATAEAPPAPSAVLATLPGATYPNQARRGGESSFVHVPAAVEVLHRHDERRAVKLVRKINACASPMRVRRLNVDLAERYAAWASDPSQPRVIEVVKFGRRFEVPIPAPEAENGESGG